MHSRRTRKAVGSHDECSDPNLCHFEPRLATASSLFFPDGQVQVHYDGFVQLAWSSVWIAGGLDGTVDNTRFPPAKPSRKGRLIASG
jgi:hypothetical protein